MQSKKLLDNEGGFTLVEIVVAAVIMTVILIPLIGVINHGMELSHQLQIKTEAMALATQKMEAIKGYYPASIVDFSNTTTGSVGSITTPETTSLTGGYSIPEPLPEKSYNNISFTRTVSWRQVNTYPPPGVDAAYTFNEFVVTVKVSWPDYLAGTTQTISLSSDFTGR